MDRELYVNAQTGLHHYWHPVLHRCGLKSETAAAFVFFFLSLYFGAHFQVWADGINTGAGHALPDTGFDLLPHIENEAISDLYIHIYWLVGIALVVIFAPTRRQDALRRMFWVLGTLYILRGFTITLTILPNPYHACEPQKHENPFLMAIKVVTGQYTTCGDVLYSGHTTILVAGAYLVHVYLCTPWFLKVLWSLLSVMGMLIIVSTHFHYSNDVLIAAVLAVYSFWIYHFALDSAKLYFYAAKHCRTTNLPSRAFVFVSELIAFMDGLDVNDIDARVLPGVSADVECSSCRSRDDECLQSYLYYHQLYPVGYTRTAMSEETRRTMLERAINV